MCRPPRLTWTYADQRTRANTSRCGPSQLLISGSSVRARPPELRNKQRQLRLAGALTELDAALRVQPEFPGDASVVIVKITAELLSRTSVYGVSSPNMHTMGEPIRAWCSVVGSVARRPPIEQVWAT